MVRPSASAALRLMTSSNFVFRSTGRSADSSALNRGHERQRAMRRWQACDGRPRCCGGAQRGSGTCTDRRACLVPPWSVSPAALAGVVCGPAWSLA